MRMQMARNTPQKEKERDKVSRANSTVAANDDDEEEDEEDEDREDAEDDGVGGGGDHGGALEVVDGGTDIIETLLLATATCYI